MLAAHVGKASGTKSATDVNPSTNRATGAGRVPYHFRALIGYHFRALRGKGMKVSLVKPASNFRLKILQKASLWEKQLYALAAQPLACLLNCSPQTACRFTQEEQQKPLRDHFISNFSLPSALSLEKILVDSIKIAASSKSPSDFSILSFLPPKKLNCASRKPGSPQVGPLPDSKLGTVLTPTSMTRI